MRALAAVLVVSSVAFAAPPKLTLSTAKTDPPADVSEAVAKLLDHEAVSVASDDNTLSLTIWFRTDLPSTASAEQIKNGLTYREIGEGTILGVVKFEKAFTDFRKQEIPAGVYTLRLAVQPDTGDHTDTAPHQDFALLVPAKTDESAEQLEVKAVVKLSLKATGGDHPGVMLLYPHTGKEEKPEVTVQKAGPRCVRLRRAVTSGDKKTTLGVSLVIDGYSKTR
jgi:hypothetical protein